MKGEGVAERVKEEFRTDPSFRDTIEIDENMKLKMEDGEVVLYRLLADSFEVKVFHQLGFEAASQTSDANVSIVEGLIKRSRQILCLRALNTTRTASEDMIPLDDSPEQQADSETEHPPLSCDVKFTAEFKLNHRLNAEMTIPALQSSVLTPFEINNRRRHFVYKDTSSSIFLLTLVELKEETLQLVVRGVDEPTGSVKEQLTDIIRARIHMLALDTLSALLRGSAKFIVDRNDVEFLRGFGAPVKHSFRIAEGVDCYVFLLYLRQNIEGSGFFHKLHCEAPGWAPEVHKLDLNPDPDETPDHLPFRSEDFTFYYNYTRSILDAVSTLTHKGAALGRKAGKGICVCRFHFPEEPTGSPPSPSPDMSTPVSDFSPAAIALRSPSESATAVAVEITNTTLEISVIIEWLDLCVRQSLVDFEVDKLMRLSRSDLLKGGVEPGAVLGFSSLRDMLEHGLSIPSMSVRQVKSEAVLRGANVKKCYERIMHDCIFSLLFKGAEGLEGLDSGDKSMWPKVSVSESREVASYQL